MIYTITFNPAIDYIITVPDYRAGEVNRAAGGQILAGGKGINVSTVLSGMGVMNTALGFTAGFTGAEVERILSNAGVQTDFIRLEEGQTRINVKLKTGAETEINARGPRIPQKAAAQLYGKLDKLKTGDMLVLAGSVPEGLPDNIYGDIAEKMYGKGVDTVIDAEGTLLLKTLRYKPFLIKPNHHEIGEMFGVTVNTRAEAEKYALKLRDMGARNVLVSLAEKGAVLVSENGESYECEAPEGRTVNSTGAGDSMVAGFLAGYLEGKDCLRALKMGVAAGSACAFSETLPDAEAIRAAYKAIRKK